MSPQRKRRAQASFNPSASALRRGSRDRPKTISLIDNEVVRPASREETLPIVVAALALACIALIVCLNKGYLLLYGDAVAHLGIARRILDARYPGLAQLGGVWLPLPHLLMLPFIGRMEWWQSGMAGAWPSLAAYVLSVAGFYRLARRLVPPLWALGATAFYALNPNLLYLATTAMTEPLFLAIILWLVLLTGECLEALAGAELARVRSRMAGIALLIVAAVYTRYDGWILTALIWCVLAGALWKQRQHAAYLRTAFVVFTLVLLAAPLGWLAYNHHFYGDALDFLRGPYSAAAIERKTSPPGAKHYRGWHNPGWALLFYTRTSQVDTTAWELGFLTLPLALVGAWCVVRRRAAEAGRRFEPAALLLWFPLPFYVYSIAWGSVPIFIPQLYPHSFYNARYGTEMLPAIALFCGVALHFSERRMRAAHPLTARLLPLLFFAGAAVNAVVMAATTPLVLKEGIVNSITRIAFERSIAAQLESFPPGSPILMSTNDHIGAVQGAGIPLRTMLSDNDRDSYEAALLAPAAKADYVVAIAGDAVDSAVRAHPEGLIELTVLCTTGQPCARVYKSAHAPDPSPIPRNSGISLRP